MFNNTKDIFMTNKPKTIHLITSISNKEYVLGTLSYNLNGNEVSFHYHCSKSSPETLLDIDSGNIIDPSLHVTWHETCIHIRSKSGILQQISYPQGSLFPKNKSVVPMYYEGVCLNGDNSILIEKSDLPWKSNVDDVVLLEQPTSTNFSLIFLLAPHDWLTQDIIIGSSISSKDGTEIPFFYLRSAAHGIARIKYFHHWDMLIFTTPLVQDLPSLDPRIGNSYRNINFTSPVDSLSSIIIKAKKEPLLDEQLVKLFHEMKDGPAHN